MIIHVGSRLWTVGHSSVSLRDRVVAATVVPGIASAGTDFPPVPGMLGDRRANEFWYRFDEASTQGCRRRDGGRVQPDAGVLRRRAELPATVPEQVAGAQQTTGLPTTGRSS
ncbi:hypothetical protein [Kibdelosporangium philippinense]|uniref:hypothetical protein n=1 Tax=Kibdelosporangium philippinense TaxID=211113 RepID=UPI00361EF3FB